MKRTIKNTLTIGLSFAVLTTLSHCKPQDADITTDAALSLASLGLTGPTGQPGPTGINTVAITYADNEASIVVNVSVNDLGADYTVPSGKVFYIESILNESVQANWLEVDGLDIMVLSGSTHRTLTQPIYMDQNEVLRGSPILSGDSIRVIGIEVPRALDPMTKSVSNVSSYVVTLGYRLNVYSLLSTVNSNVLFVDGNPVFYLDSGNASHNLSMPLRVSSGETLSALACCVYFNGYEK